jgi:hypothetical protein
MAVMSDDCSWNLTVQDPLPLADRIRQRLPHEWNLTLNRCLGSRRKEIPATGGATERPKMMY